MEPWGSLPLVASTAVAGVLSAVTALYVWRTRGVGSRSLALILVGAAVWSLAYALELQADDLAVKQAWGAVKYVGVGLLPPAWLTFVLEYTGRRRWLRPELLLALAIEPVVVLGLLFNPGTQHWVRYYTPAPGGLTLVEVGPAFWPHMIYTNLLLLVATGMFVVSLVRLSRHYRRQSVVLLAAVAVPWTANLLYNLPFAPLRPFRLVDLTPIGFCLLGVVLVWGVFGFRLLDLVPVARAQVIERMRDGVVVLDAFQRVVDINPAAARLLGVARGKAIGRHCRELLPEAERQGVERLWDEPLWSSREWDPSTEGPAAVELRVDDADGRERYLRLTMTPLGDEQGSTAGQLVMLHDITDRRRAELRLERLAFQDPLTGLPNRQLFIDRLTHDLSRARRSNETLGVLFIDLDGFKTANDTVGHQGGDEVLKQVGRRLSTSLREVDTVARFGGDEFAVLLPEISHPDDAALVATKLLRALETPFVVKGHELRIGASIGISLFPADGSDADSLLVQADRAMYQAKAEGKNRYSFAGRWVPPVGAS